MKEWLNILEESGFKCVYSCIGKQDYRHPKHKDYMITFDWGTLIVFRSGSVVFETRDINLGIIDGIVHKIKYPKHSKWNC